MHRFTLAVALAHHTSVCTMTGPAIAVGRAGLGLALADSSVHVVLFLTFAVTALALASAEAMLSQGLPLR
jgi:hypothetical protein